MFTQTTKNFNTHHITIHNVIRAATSSKSRPNLASAKSVKAILKQQIFKLASEAAKTSDQPVKLVTIKRKGKSKMTNFAPKNIKHWLSIKLIF